MPIRLDSYDTRRNGQTARIGATLGLDEAERRARQALQVLDTLVEPALNQDQPLLGNWKSVRRIPRKPGPARETVVQPASGNGAPPPVVAGAAVPLLPAPLDTAPVEAAEDGDPGDKQAA